MKLDLGCGEKPLDGYVGVDLPLDTRPRLDPLYGPDARGGYHLRGDAAPQIDERGIIRFDLASGRPWPFADDSIDELYSSHMIEHIPLGTVYAYEFCKWRREGGITLDLEERSATPNEQGLRCIGKRDALLRFMDEAWRVTKPGGCFRLLWPALERADTGQILTGAFHDPTHQRFIPLTQVHYWSRIGRESRGVSQYPTVCNWLITGRVLQRQRGETRLQVVENEILLRKEP